jgi:hypothetical protein
MTCVKVMMGATGVMEWIVGLQRELPAVQGIPFHASQITPEFDVLFSRYDGSFTGQ